MSADALYLLEKAKENYQAAKLLSEEGFLDIAASRAYYVLFYLAEALLQKRGLIYASHSAVIAAFGKEFAKTGALDPKFHQYLIKAQELRQTGDYGHQEYIAAENVQQVLNWAEEFIEVVEKSL